MKESEFSNIFIKNHLKQKFPFMWYKKIHGDEYQKDIADNLFCINSLFVAIEFKIQRDGKISITPMQIKELNEIKNAKGISLIVAFDENTNKILIRETRLDYKKIFLSPSNIDNDKNIKKRYIKIDWDFEYSSYEEVIDLIYVLIENK